MEKLRGSLKVKSAVLPAFSVSTRADSLLESGEMIFRARFIQIFVQLDGSFDDPLLLLLLLFLLSKVSSFVASLRVSYFFNLLSFLFFPFFFLVPLSSNTVRKYAGNTKDLFTYVGREKGRTCHGKAEEKSRLAEIRTTIKEIKIVCLVRPTTGLPWDSASFFVPLFPFQLRSICSIHAFSTPIFTFFFPFFLFFPLISRRSCLFDRYASR